MNKRETFESLYRDHAARVKAYGLRRVGSEAAADEIVSDVSLVVWRRLATVPEDPLPWLLGVARLAVTNRHRSQRRRAALTARMADAEDAAVEPAPSPARMLDSENRVIKALATLSERDRELLMLVAWEGLEPAQLAEALGVSRGTANVRLHRARRRLATALVTNHPRHLEEAIR